MKLSDIIQSATDKTPSLEIDVETVDGREYAATFRNLILLTEEERTEMFKIGEEKVAEAEPELTPTGRVKKVQKAKAFEDPITKRAANAKQGLALVVRPDPNNDVMADLEAVFMQNPEARDLSWIALEGEWGKATQPEKAEASQES